MDEVERAAVRELFSLALVEDPALAGTVWRTAGDALVAGCGPGDEVVSGLPDIGADVRET